MSNPYSNRRIQSHQFNGETFHFHVLRGYQLQMWLREKSDEEVDGLSALAMIVAFCACNKDGERYWTDDEEDKVLQDVDFDVIKEIGSAVARASGVDFDDGDDDGEAAKNV